ncbi:MAG: hypothetical protein ACRC46_13615 [Thermoguttaceae bacterium]
MKVFVSCALMAVVTLVCSGCGGQPLPPGFPTNLVPCEVTVTKGGSPMDEADILLVANSGEQGAWVVSGRTSAQGVATIYTTCVGVSKLGAPVGGYKVVINKANPPIVDPTPQATIDAMEYEARKAHSEKLSQKYKALPPLVPVVLSNATTTPVSVEVAASGKTLLTVNVDDYAK